MKHLGKRVFSAIVSGVFFVGSTGVGAAAPAKPSLRSADRELKPYKNYDPGDIYERAHRIIYGSQNRSRINDEYRTQIAVVLTGNEWLMVEDRIRNDIYRQLRKKFPREDFGVYKGNDVNTYLLTRAEELYDREREKSVGWGPKDLSKDVDGIPADADRMHAYVGDGPAVGSRQKPRGFADLQLRDYVDAGRDCSYDYVLALALDLGGQKISDPHEFVIFSNETLHQNVWLRVRLVDVAKGNYAYRNNIVLQGKVHNTIRVLSVLNILGIQGIPLISGGIPVPRTRGFNGPLLERAVHNALAEALRDIEVVP